MKKADNHLLVIFGASGDLTRRKLMPSLFELYVRGLLPKRFAILGASRSEYTDDTFRQQQREGIRRSAKGASYDDGQIDEFLRMIHYVSFEPTEYATYGNLKNRIGELLETLGSPDRVVYYLATPPVLYETIPAGLKEAGLNVAATKKGWRRIVVEKPFGTDLESARRLSELLRGVFEENGIYRIDHYLGKETVQNILVLRFSNGIFEPLWNRNYIDYVEISATETLGVENRGPYYESAGALRDMIQNHLLQLMAFVAMEPPAVFEPEPIRNEIVKVFRAIRRYTPAEIGRNVLRAQYTGCEIDGQYVPGYREEKNVAPDSTTETFVAMKLFIDNWRWGGVPFLFHTGKRLSKKQSEVVIHFKSTPTQLFSGQCSGRSCNKLTLRIQPDESISLKFGLKMPGAGLSVRQVSMDFRYDSLSSDYLPDAYERLLLDVMLGDSTLYARRDSLEASWQFIDPILRAWKQNPQRGLLTYPVLTEGPDPQQLLEDGNDRPDENCTLDESIFQE